MTLRELGTNEQKLEMLLGVGNGLCPQMLIT